MSEATIQYKPQDFKSDQEIRWCAGCGDSAVHNAVLKTLAELGIPKHQNVFVSGIGCSSRFPYYMSTYGIHGIHGRAAAIASGVKVANRDLKVWEITGDGDSMAIGGNHFIHIIRRNIDVNLILLNNQIYGLTKGQYSPTSEYGAITKTSPYGTIENPFCPGSLTIGSRGRFFARVPDNDIKLMVEVFKEAAQFRGTAVVEVLQNCVIYNDKAHAAITGKEVREDAQLILEHGKPMIFGKYRNKGLIFKGLGLEVVTIGENGITEKDIIVHNKFEEKETLQTLLVKMAPPEFPVAMGIIRSVIAPTYSDVILEQIQQVKAKSKIKNMTDLLNSGSTWEIE